MVKTVKRLVKALAAIAGYEVENDVQIQHTLFTNVLKFGTLWNSYSFLKSR